MSPWIHQVGAQGSVNDLFGSVTTPSGTSSAPMNRREARDLSEQCQRLARENERLRCAANSSRVEASALRRQASVASRELEGERKARETLGKQNKKLEAARAKDHDAITKLEQRLSKGTPSARVLEKACELKHITENLQEKLRDQSRLLSARECDLEQAKREVQVLTTALRVKTQEMGIPGGTENPSSQLLMSLGKERLRLSGLALELAHASERGDRLAVQMKEAEEMMTAEAKLRSSCEENCLNKVKDLEKRLGEAAGEMADLRVKGEEDATSRREISQSLDQALARENELLDKLAKASSHCKNQRKELATLLGKSKALSSKVDSMEHELKSSSDELKRERERTKAIESKLQESKLQSDMHAQEQAFEARRMLEDFRHEEGRLLALLEGEQGRRTRLEEEMTRTLEDLRIVVEERDTLGRALHVAKDTNQALAKSRNAVELREKEALSRVTETREAKLALQRALLEQLSSTRAELRAERERRRKAEASMAKLLTTAEAATCSEDERSYSSEWEEGSEAPR
ncbi:unnamed protein product, partial [Discosporangium mesarthrocarpum]